MNFNSERGDWNPGGAGWLWIIVAVLAIIALIIFIVANASVDVKNDPAAILAVLWA